MPSNQFKLILAPTWHSLHKIGLREIEKQIFFWGGGIVGGSAAVMHKLPLLAPLLKAETYFQSSIQQCWDIRIGNIVVQIGRNYAALHRYANLYYCWQGTGRFSMSHVWFDGTGSKRFFTARGENFCNCVHLLRISDLKMKLSCTTTAMNILSFETGGLSCSGITKRW